MKHIIEFNLPEEKDELALTMKAADMSIVLHEFYNRVLRNNLKYGLHSTLRENTGATEGSKEEEIAEKVLEYVNSQFWEIVNEYDVEV